MLSSHFETSSPEMQRIGEEAWLANCGHLEPQTIGFILTEWKAGRLDLRITETAFSNAYQKYNKEGR